MLYSNRAHFRSGRARPLWGLVLAAGLALAPPAQALTPGEVLVIDATAGTNSQGALFVVDPATGARTLLSDFGSGANPGAEPVGVAVESNGTLLVVDADAGTGSLGALFRVDPLSGARTLLSDFGSGANEGVDPVRRGGGIERHYPGRRPNCRDGLSGRALPGRSPERRPDRALGLRRGRQSRH
ncbi:MAG: hypothetical protein ACREXJ_06850 [Gammaproteobacteria bacterium]